MSDTDSLQPLLDDHRTRSAQKRAPEVNAALARFLERLGDANVGAGAKRVGDEAPGFDLPDQLGRAVSLGDLLGRGPVVLAFYRGVW